MRNWLLGAIIIFFSLGLLCGQQYAQSGVGGGFAFPHYWTLVIFGLSIAVVIISISYMIGEATGLANIKAFAKQETYELASTAIIVLVLAGTLLAFGAFSENLSNTYLIDPADGEGDLISGVCVENTHVYDTSDATRPEAHLYANIDWFLGCFPITGDGILYLEKMRNEQPAGNTNYISPNENMWEVQRDVWGDKHSKGVMLGHMMNVWTGLLSLEFILGPISTLGISAFLPEGILSSITLDMAPMSGLTPISDALVMIADMVGIGLVVVIVQKVLLEYIYQNAFAVFLPVGIAFRAIPFLRKTGSTIIAVAIVLYFIFPMSIWINEQIYFNSLFSYDSQNGEYRSELIDWTNYNSLLELCIVREGESYSQYEQRILEEHISPFYTNAEEQSDAILDIYGQDMASRLPMAQQRSIAESFTQNLGIVLGYFTDGFLFNWAWIFGPVLPIGYLFEAIIDAFTVSMQWFVLNLLFLVNSIVLSVTFFKDLSIAMGGEPRIFGMSKLV